ncbi:hypothetical protein [Salana multivorans]
MLNNPVALSSLVTTVSKSISADDSLDAQTMTGLALSLRQLGTNDIVFFTAPYTGTGRSADGQSIIELDFPALGSLMEAWQADDLSTYLETHQSELDSLPSVVS